jgi:hypothetical protein
MVFILLLGVGHILNFAKIHVWLAAASSSGIQETELKPFLANLGTETV